jgi:hypothetical protein
VVLGVQTFRTTLTHQNAIQEGIKSRLSSANCWCYSFAECFVFQIGVQNVKIKICRSIILPVVLFMCETWWLTMREEPKPRMFENRVLRGILVPKGEAVIEE